MYKYCIIILIICILFTSINICLAEEIEGSTSIPDYYYSDCPENGISIKKEYAFNHYILVYKPYNYDKNKQYDVLILLNGKNGSAYDLLSKNQLTNNGKIKIRNIYDWLIYENKMKPILIVTTDAEEVNTRDIRRIIEYITEKYNIYTYANTNIADKNHIWLGGLSLGCNKTLANILYNTDVIGNFLLFSGSRQFDDVLRILESNENKKPINTLYVGCGKKDAAYKLNISYYTELSKYSNTSNMNVYEYGHDWNTWVNSIYDALQLCFNNTSTMHEKLSVTIYNIIKLIKNN